jgi:hypothetical protein
MALQLSIFQISKNTMFLIIFYVFSFYKIRKQEGRTGSAWRGFDPREKGKVSRKG